MNIQALKTLLVDDLRGLAEAHQCSIERLEGFAFRRVQVLRLAAAETPAEASRTVEVLA